MASKILNILLWKDLWHDVKLAVEVELNPKIFRIWVFDIQLSTIINYSYSIP